jgi:hypothetical protein
MSDKDTDRRGTRSPLTASALTHCLAALRGRVDAELIVLGSSKGTPIAWAGDTVHSWSLAAVAPGLDLVDEAARTHRFELGGDTMTLCVAGAALAHDECVQAVASIRRIWEDTHKNGFGQFA